MIRVLTFTVVVIVAFALLNVFGATLGVGFLGGFVGALTAAVGSAFGFVIGLAGALVGLLGAVIGIGSVILVPVLLVLLLGFSAFRLAFLALYAPLFADATAGDWKQHVIEEPVETVVHALAVADFPTQVMV